jgi:site-specific recombinase XerD
MSILGAANIVKNHIRPPVKVDENGRLIRDPSVRAHRWLLNVPASITGHKKERHFFRTLREANAYRETLLEAHHKVGADILERLRQRGMSVVDAIEYALHHAPKKSGPKRLADACEAYLAMRTDLNSSRAYIANLRSHFVTLREDLGNPLIDAISKSELELFIKGLTGKDGDTPALPKTKVNMIITLNALFNFAVEEGWRGENPAAKLRRPKLDEVDTPILSPEECRKLLEEGSKPQYQDVFPALVTQMFGAPRRSEIPHINWENFNDQYLRLDKTKVRKKRPVLLPEAALLWLAPLRKRTGKLFEPAGIEFDAKDTRSIQDAYTYRVSQIATAAGVVIPKNALRHTPITYRVVETGNVAKSAFWAGNSPKVIERHYLGAATETDAHAFYALKPQQSFEAPTSCDAELVR